MKAWYWSVATRGAPTTSAPTSARPAVLSDSQQSRIDPGQDEASEAARERADGNDERDVMTLAGLKRTAVEDPRERGGSICGDDGDRRRRPYRERRCDE